MSDINQTQILPGNFPVTVMPGKPKGKHGVIAGISAACVVLVLAWQSQRITAQSALVTAARQGNIAQVRDALASGVSISARNVAGETPLAVAVASGQGTMTRFLLDKGANPNDGMNAAARTGQAAFVRLLLERGASGTDTERGLWLCLAAQNRTGDCVRLLLAHGANVNASNTPDDNMTPLLYAARSGKAGMVGLLLEAGANKNAVTSTGRTALMLAASWSEPAACKVLLDAGANINAHDTKGQTALMQAAVVGNAPTLAYLLARGANRVLRDDAGKTALDHAHAKNDARIAALLQAMSKPTPPKPTTTVSGAQVSRPGQVRYSPRQARPVPGRR